MWHRGGRDRGSDLTALELDSLAAIEEDVGSLLGGNAEERKTSLELLRRMPG